MMNLVKVHAPGSDRADGLKHLGLDPSQIPIAGKVRAAILSALGLPGFAIGRISADNAFVARAGEAIYYLFVRPTYTGYRQVAIRRFGGIPAEYDADHVHARNFAVQFGYRFVLAARVPKSINRQHGIYEQHRQKLETSGEVPDVCTFDHRIVDKVLGRSSRIRRGLSPKDYRYDPHAKPDIGLTLKQRGLWNRARDSISRPPRNSSAA